MTDERYGLLTVIGKDGRYRICLCDCGKQKRVRIDHLINRKIISCGCAGRKNVTASNTTHGMSHTRVFKIWLGIIDRCKNDRSGNYGQRGIKVCDQWLRFEKFYEDMGNPPTIKHSIDRINVNGNYEPGNCRWATTKTQNRNKRNNTVLTHAGETKTLAEWSYEKGIKPSTLCYRLYCLGWNTEKALSTPVQKHLNNKPWVTLGISRSTYYRHEFERVGKP